MLCVKIGQTGFSYLVTRPAFVEQYNFMSCELYGQQTLGEGLFPQVAFRSGASFHPRDGSWGGLDCCRSNG